MANKRKVVMEQDEYVRIPYSIKKMSDEQLEKEINRKRRKQSSKTREEPANNTVCGIKFNF